MNNYHNQQHLIDIFYMKKAIKLSKNGQYSTDPNPNVGCIIVLNNKIVGFGWHKKPGKNHAEVTAINMAGELSRNSTAYISLEPCNFFGKTPPCCNLIVKSGIKRVVIASIDPNPKVSGKGIQYLKKNGIQVTYGILKKESEKINSGFIKRMTTGIPWITFKIAISIDGKIAMQNGESKWITSNESINNVHKFRFLNTVILSTSKTVIQDNPKLTARYENKKNNISYKQPIRVILDSKNQIKLHHNIIKETISDIWLIRLFKDKLDWPTHVKQIIIPSNNNQINLKKLLKFLGKKQINRIWIECGSNLFSNMLNMHLIDEIILYIAPKMLGHLSKPLYLNYTNSSLNESLQFNFKEIKNIGTDIRIKIKPIFKKSIIIPIN